MEPTSYVVIGYHSHLMQIICFLTEIWQLVPNSRCFMLPCTDTETIWWNKTDIFCSKSLSGSKVKNYWKQNILNSYYISMLDQRRRGDSEDFLMIHTHFRCHLSVQGFKVQIMGSRCKLSWDLCRRFRILPLLLNEWHNADRMTETLLIVYMQVW